jgi:template-activating factor I
VPEDGSITLDMAHFEPDDLVPSVSRAAALATSYNECITRHDQIKRKVLMSEQSTTIDWKSDEQNLCKRFPRDKAQVLEEQDIDDDDFDGDTGSFFHYFTESYDPYEVSRFSTLY